MRRLCSLVCLLASASVWAQIPITCPNEGNVLQCGQGDMTLKAEPADDDHVFQASDFKDGYTPPGPSGQGALIPLVEPGYVGWLDWSLMPDGEYFAVCYVGQDGDQGCSDIGFDERLAEVPPPEPPVDDFVTLSWDAVTTNEDGSPVTDLAGYRVYRSALPGGPYDVQETVAFPVAVAELNDGDNWFVVTAFDTIGNESAYSNEAYAPFEGGPLPSEGFDMQCIRLDTFPDDSVALSDCRVN